MKQALVLSILVFAASALMPGISVAGEWGLGVGVAAQKPPQEGTDTQVVVLPFPSYEGERLSLGFGTVAYALTTSERFRFALEGQLRFDGYDPDDSAALSGLRERDVTLDAGVSLTSTHDWGVASVRFMADALGVHEGYEISASYAYPLQFDRWTVVPAITANWSSADLVNYYYGVRLDEAAEGRPAYDGDAVVNVAASLNASYALSERWEIIGGAEYTRLGDAITDSPIIANDHELIMYSAVAYRF